MHLISASRRTDLPAFYADWFLQRVRAGEISWVHPFNSRIQTVSLKPREVAAIVFWTRNFAPMMRHLDELESRGYRYLVHFTITALPRTYETHVPTVKAALKQFRKLSNRLGPDRVIWRYDPILIAPGLDADHHLRSFESLTEALEGLTHRCVTSFVKVYGKVRRNFDGKGLSLLGPSVPFRQVLVRHLAERAAARGIRLEACCNDDLVGPEVGKAHCIDLQQVRRLWPGLEFEVRPSPSREECGCYRSYDVGAYDSCLHGCLYCYATRSRTKARTRYRQHDPSAAVMIPGRERPVV